ncbi:hypothetical protein [Peribacillus simplex]|nr:hypothetical protein [Peribacillus simplex]
MKVNAIAAIIHTAMTTQRLVFPVIILPSLPNIDSSNEGTPLF